MKYCREKIKILEENPELQLCDNGDFKIDVDLVDNYEIIDIDETTFNSSKESYYTFNNV